jgi:hypothetical protein
MLMEGKDFILAILALLAVIATAFISVRGDVRDLTIQVSALNARLNAVHETCCGELK